jgi:nitrogen fixation protein FixH
MSAIRISSDDSIYVGTRVEVEMRLFDRRTNSPASALAPILSFHSPSGTVLDVGAMIEQPAGSGFYYGSDVLDEEGEWSVRVQVSAPFESVFRHDHVYVSS